jgi:hypothetical protein
MMKASHLIKENDYEQKLCESNYNIQLDKCLEYIKMVNKSRKTTYYKIPHIISDPYYNYLECKNFLKKELKKKEFLAVNIQRNDYEIYISWKKTDVEYIQTELEKIKQERELEKLEIEQKIEEKKVMENEKKVMENEKKVMWHPKSAISELKLTTRLMKDNPKYSHLKSLKKK